MHHKNLGMAIIKSTSSSHPSHNNPAAAVNKK
jgi:hypothetical protein